MAPVVASSALLSGVPMQNKWRNPRMHVWVCTSFEIEYQTEGMCLGEVVLNTTMFGVQRHRVHPTVKRLEAVFN